MDRGKKNVVRENLTCDFILSVNETLVKKPGFFSLSDIWAVFKQKRQKTCPWQWQRRGDTHPHRVRGDIAQLYLLEPSPLNTHLIRLHPEPTADYSKLFSYFKNLFSQIHKFRLRGHFLFLFGRHVIPLQPDMKWRLRPHKLRTPHLWGRKVWLIIGWDTLTLP